MEKQKERLVELIENADVQINGNVHPYMDYGIDTLADKILADGWMRPPCKVGDVIYDIRNGKVFGGKIIMISYFGDSFTFVSTGGRYYTFTDIGKTVFLTKEEAEQALRKDEGK